MLLPVFLEFVYEIDVLAEIGCAWPAIPCPVSRARWDLTALLLSDRDGFSLLSLVGDVRRCLCDTTN